MAHYLNCSIEDVLDHDIDWLNMILMEVLRQEMEQNIFQMSIHKFQQKSIDKYRRSCERVLSKDKKVKVVLPPLSRFQHQGLAIGKDNKTKVKR